LVAQGVTAEQIAALACEIYELNQDLGGYCATLTKPETPPPHHRAKDPLAFANGS